jgi:hypothetical protein
VGSAHPHMSGSVPVALIFHAPSLVAPSLPGLPEYRLSHGEFTAAGSQVNLPAGRRPPAALLTADAECSVGSSKYCQWKITSTPCTGLLLESSTRIDQMRSSCTCVVRQGLVVMRARVSRSRDAQQMFATLETYDSTERPIGRQTYPLRDTVIIELLRD